MKLFMNADEVRDFANHVLPWIEKATGLDRKGKPLPEFVVLAHDELNKFISKNDPAHSSARASGGYSPDLNKMLVDVTARNGDWNYIKSIIVHELTHFLQDANGMLDPSFRLKSELMAYTVQGAWLKYEKGIEPAHFGLTKESVIMRALIS